MLVEVDAHPENRVSRFLAHPGYVAYLNGADDTGVIGIDLLMAKLTRTSRLIVHLPSEFITSAGRKGAGLLVRVASRSRHLSGFTTVGV
jgi:hypothetical protein